MSFLWSEIYVHGSNAVLPVLLVERENQTPRGATFFWRRGSYAPFKKLFKNLEINKIGGGASSFGNNTVGRTSQLSEKKADNCRDSHKVWDKKLNNFTREKERATKFVRSFGYVRQCTEESMWWNTNYKSYYCTPPIFLFFFYFFSN